MNLIRWEPQLGRLEPFQMMDDVTREMGRLLGPRWFRPFEREESLTVADWTPAVDIQETEKEYLVKAELPEVKREDVKVTIEDNILMLTGERKAEKEEKGRKFHRIERFYGTFQRTFTVPPDAEESKVTAEFKDGVLFVHIPKGEKAKPKAIEVKPS